MCAFCGVGCATAYIFNGWRGFHGWGVFVTGRFGSIKCLWRFLAGVAWNLHNWYVFGGVDMPGQDMAWDGRCGFHSWWRSQVCDRDRLQ